MKMKHTKSIIASATVIAAALLIILGCGRETAPPPGIATGDKQTDIRIGWMTSLAIQGQQVQALKASDALNKNGLRGKFTSFTYGPPQIEAALSGSLDVVSAGTVPILTLLNKSTNWVIVARHANVRFGLGVPPESSTKHISDLKGKKIAVSIGSSAEQFLLRQIAAEGLSAADFEMINIGPEEQAELVRAGSRSQWGEVSAMVSWEPTLSLLETKDLVRVIKSDVDPTWMAFSRDFVREHPEAAIAYLQATLEAWHYYATHRELMNEAYRKESNLQIDSQVLEKIATYDSNVAAKTLSDVDIDLNDAAIKNLNEAVAFLVQKGRLDKSFSLETRIDRSFINKAQQDVRSGK